MRLCYVLLSPTFGMHQYTADLANRVAAAGHDVHLVTTASAPRDRYTQAVTIHTPVTTKDTGFSRDALRYGGLRALYKTVGNLQPDIVHFSGPHLWNVPLLRALTSFRRIPVIHTLHDLDPHSGTRFAGLLRIWNHLVLHTATHIIVHGQVYRQRLLADGFHPNRITCTPLLHLFVGCQGEKALVPLSNRVEYQPWGLFFGRLERYKGVPQLLAACKLMGMNAPGSRIMLAGPGNLTALWPGALPPNLEVRNRFVSDNEAIELFRHCGVLVLPYSDATQSALIAAAYYFHKPVLVTRAGALPEYVVEGETGHVVEPGQPVALADRLETMLNDARQLARMGAAGRAWYETQRRDETQTLFSMYESLSARPLADRQPVIQRA